MRNRTSDYRAARVCKGINLRGREANNTVPNSITVRSFMPLTSGKSEPHSFFLISDLRRNFGVHIVERVLL